MCVLIMTNIVLAWLPKQLRQWRFAHVIPFTEHTAPYKKLRGGVRFVDAIPKSPSGKILRRVIKEQIRAEMKPKAKL